MTSKDLAYKQRYFDKRGFVGCNSCSVKTYRDNRTDVERYRYIYNAYKKASLDRNYSFELSREVFTKLILSPCLYCGKTKSNSRKDKLTGDPLYYNGVDRMDNTCGYTDDNSVACCNVCNYMKRDQTVKEFLIQCKRISKYDAQRSSRKGVGASAPKQETSSIEEDDMISSI